MEQINEWLTISQLSGEGNTTLTLNASSSMELENRIQSLRVSVEGKEVYVNISQKAFIPSLTTNKTGISFSQNNLTQSLQITSNVDWVAVPSADWITLSQSEGLSGVTNISINTTTISSPNENRSGVISFYWGDILMKSINVVQDFEVVFEVSTTSIDMTENLTATITVSSNTNWSIEYNSDWFSVSPINGNGDGSITITAEEFNDINRSSIIYFTMNDIIVDSVRVYQEYINTDVEVPTDIENCFYIEPIEGSLKVGNNYSGNSTAYVRYYENGMWNDLVRSSTPNLTIRKRTYFSYGKFSAVFITDKKFNIGGRISTITGIPTSSLPSIGKAPKFKDTKVVDASNLILDVNPLTFEWGANKDGCYESMFENCIELLNPPLQITYTGGTNCCERMFYGCINMQYAPHIVNTDTDYYGILNFERMFYGCSKIKVVYINIQEVRREMFMSMFQYCEQLREVILTPPNLGNSSDYVDWLKGVSATGIIYKNPNATLPDGIVPEGWEVRDYEG